MECLDNYKIGFLDRDEIEIYTEKLVESFNVKNFYQIYLDDNICNYRRGYIYLVAKIISENLIIGGICLESKSKYKNDIFIEHLFVDSKYRNQMVATNLLRYIIDNKYYLFKSNKKCLNLYCDNNVKGFYEKNNFYEEGSFICSDQKVFSMKRKI